MWAADEPQWVAVGRHVNAASNVCNGLGQNKIVRVGKNSGPVLSRLWTKVHEILGQCRKPFVLSNAIARLSSFGRYSLLRLEVVEQTNKCKFLAPQFFPEGRSQLFLWQIVSAIYRPAFGKVWLSSVCWSASVKSGNEVECGIYGEWVKTTTQFWAVCGLKFMLFWEDVGDPL